MEFSLTSLKQPVAAACVLARGASLLAAFKSKMFSPMATPGRGLGSCAVEKIP